MADPTGTPSDAEPQASGTRGSDGAEHDPLSVNEWVSELRRLYVEPKEGADERHDAAMSPLRRKLHLRGPRRGAQPVEGEREREDLSPRPQAPGSPPTSPPRQEPVPRTNRSPADSWPDAFDRAPGSSSPADVERTDPEPAAAAGTEDGLSPGAWLSSYLQATTVPTAEEAEPGGGATMTPADSADPSEDAGQPGPGPSGERADGSLLEPVPVLDERPPAPDSEMHVPRGLAELAALSDVTSRPAQATVDDPVPSGPPEAALPPVDPPAVEPDPQPAGTTDSGPPAEVEQEAGATFVPEALPEDHRDVHSDSAARVFEPEPESAARPLVEPDQPAVDHVVGPQPPLVDQPEPEPTVDEAVNLHFPLDSEPEPVPEAPRDAVAEWGRREPEAEPEPASTGHSTPEALAREEEGSDSDEAVPDQPPGQEGNDSEAVEPGQRDAVAPAMVAVPALASRLEAARASRQEPNSTAPDEQDAPIHAPAAPISTADQGLGTADHTVLPDQAPEPSVTSEPFDDQSDEQVDEQLDDQAGEPPHEPSGTATNTPISVSWRGTEYMDFLEMSRPEADDTKELIIVEPPSQLFSTGRRRRAVPTEAVDTDSAEATDLAETLDAAEALVPDSSAPAPSAPMADTPPTVEAPARPASRTGRWVLLAVVLVGILAAAAWYLLLRDDGSSTAWGGVGLRTATSSAVAAASPARVHPTGSSANLPRESNGYGSR